MYNKKKIAFIYETIVYYNGLTVIFKAQYFIFWYTIF